MEEIEMKATIRGRLHRQGIGVLLIISIHFFLRLSSSAIWAADKYENDDTFIDAKMIPLWDQVPDHVDIPDYEWRQDHTFHVAGDEDWVKFPANIYNQVYKIIVDSPGENCDPEIEVYKSDGKTLILSRDHYGKGESEYLEFRPTYDGIHYARIRNHESQLFGEKTDYQLILTLPIGIPDGAVYGWVEPSEVETVLTTDSGGLAITDSGGFYFMLHITGDHILYAGAKGFQPFSTPITVSIIHNQYDLILDPIPEETAAPEIQAHGFHNVSNATEGEPVILNLSLAANGQEGREADWWIAELTPGGTWNFFDLNTMAFAPALGVTIQAPLSDFSDIPLKLNDLSPGEHLFVFGVDMEKDGGIDFDQMHHDSVTVNVMGEEGKKFKTTGSLIVN